MSKAEVVTSPPSKPSWRPSPLLIRIISGTVILAAFLVLLYAGLWGIYAMVAVIAALGLWEFSRLSERLGFRAPAWLLYPLAAFFILSGTLLKWVDVELTLALALVAGLGIFLFLPGRRQGLGGWAMGMAGALYLGAPFNFYLLLYVSKPASRGVWWILFTILAVVAADAAALFVGSRFGRHPFFAAISPHKTVEGAVAGLLGAAVVFVAGGLGVLDLGLGPSIAIGFLVGIGALLGDLVESQMKRLAEVKDSSNLIPGHGGVLDRIDSALFPPILVYAFAVLTGLVH